MTVRRVHVGPDQLWAGNRQSVCDGALLDVHLDDANLPERVDILQLHDIKPIHRRTLPETRHHLMMCGRLLRQHGIVFAMDDDVFLVRGSAVRLSDRLTLHLYPLPVTTQGPFLPSEPDDG